MFIEHWDENHVVIRRVNNQMEMLFMTIMFIQLWGDNNEI